MDVADKFKINLNQPLWGLIISYSTAGLSQPYAFHHLWWLAFVVSIAISLSVVVLPRVLFNQLLLPQVEGQCMKKGLILAILAFTGCCRPSQRFVSTTEITALDTKTGQECRTLPKSIEQSGDMAKFPYCIDLYNGR